MMDEPIKRIPPPSEEEQKFLDARRQAWNELLEEHEKCKRLLLTVNIGVVGQSLSDRVKEAVDHILVCEGKFDCWQYTKPEYLE